MATISPVFSVKSVYVAVEWYQRVLGFESLYLNEEVGEEDSLNYAVLAWDGIGLHLGLVAEMDVRAGNSGCQINTRRFEQAHRRATEEGADFKWQIVLNPVGERNFGLRDPDGNQIVITEIK